MSEKHHNKGSEWLADAGVRPTRQRVALATLLVGDGQNRHVTAESLHAASQNAGEAVSLATVYNTLRAFCDAGLIKEITVDGSKSYFDTRTDDHPHFYWEDEARRRAGNPTFAQGACRGRDCQGGCGDPAKENLT